MGSETPTTSKPDKHSASDKQAQHDRRRNRTSGTGDLDSPLLHLLNHRHGACRRGQDSSK